MILVQTPVSSNSFPAMEIIPIPAFRDNYIWTLVQGKYAVCVDPGDAAPVQQFLTQHDLRLTAVINTHHHWDHTGGNTVLISRSNIPLYGPKSEAIEGLTHKLSEGDQITLAEISVQLRVLDIPGHTSGHIALYNDDMVFCGDTLFACGCGRLFEGTPGQMSASLEKLAALNNNTKIYCGHEYTLANIAFAKAVEPENKNIIEREKREAAKRAEGKPTLPSTIGEELLTNPFLRCTEPAVIQAAEKYAGTSLNSKVAVFAALRVWKNNF
jgi:hydroxyacylglutathione hydrolase